MMLESVKSVREDDFILKLFYHCSFCLIPNDPENKGENRFIVKLEENNGIIKTMAEHRCFGCGKINKFVLK